MFGRRRFGKHVDGPTICTDGRLDYADHVVVDVFIYV
jgi:hypothetical protein